MSTPTVDQLLAFNPAPFHSVAAVWGEAADSLSSSVGAISSAHGLITNWKGQAADAASASVDELVSSVKPSPAALREGQQTLQAYALKVAECQHELRPH